MTVRDPGCPDCRSLSSGDCGQHGPMTWGVADRSTSVFAPPTAADVLSAPMAAGLLLLLKQECEKQHARAEQAEAALAQMRAERDAEVARLERLHMDICEAHEEQFIARERAEQQLATAREHLNGLASWIRTPGNINREDAIDECARAVENLAAALAPPPPEQP